jgi:hypothetical protein
MEMTQKQNLSMTIVSAMRFIIYSHIGVGAFFF